MATLSDLSLKLRELKEYRDNTQDFLDQSIKEVSCGASGDFAFFLAKIQYDLFVKHALELQSLFGQCKS